MREMVESNEYRHVPTGRLAILAQRLGKVYTSDTTWWRMVRKRGWCRPRHRVYPAKPKLGVRASKPNELWHVDLTIVKLLDGTRVYLHAVIDSYSRRILACRREHKQEVAELASNHKASSDSIPEIGN